MKRFLNGALAALILLAGVGSVLAADVKPLIVDTTTGKTRPVHAGETVPVANGGTGATTASAARTALGIAVGSDVQAHDADLDALAGVTSAADKVPYFTGSGTATTATLTTAGRALIDDADASAQRTTLGLGTFATQNYATPPAIGGTTPAAGAFSTLSASSTLTTNVTGSTQCLRVNSSGVVSGAGADCGTGGGSVTTTGSPASGNVAKFSGSTSVTSGDLSGDVTTSGTLATTIANSAVTLAKIANASANSKLLGSGASGSGSAYSEISLGTGLSMSGTTLSASSGGGTPALELISEVTTSGTQTSVDFTSISAAYRDLEVRIRGRGATAATSIAVTMRLNNDSGANYDYITAQTNNALTTGFPVRAATQAYVGNLAAASAPSGVSDVISVFIGDYRGTTFQKAGRKEATLKIGTAANTDLYTENGGWWWRSTAAINQVTFFITGGLVNGSVVSLYGHY